MVGRPRGVIAVFAKPPRPGSAKTRLAVAVGDDEAAALARDLLADAWAVACRVPGVRVVLATPEPAADHGLGAVEAWDQGGGDLGARVARVLARGLAVAPVAVAVGADTTALTAGRLDALLGALGDGVAALAPARDGGFWALALRACPPGLLADLPWSGPTTAAAVRARLVERLGAVVEGEPGFDVDTLDDVRHLLAEAAAGRAGEGAALRRARAWAAAGRIH